MLVRPSRIDQIISSFVPRDAISTECDLVRHFLLARQFVSEIFAEHLHPAFSGYGNHIHNIGPLAPVNNNLLIAHYSIGSSIPYCLRGMKAFKIVCNHNVTPPKYFSWDPNLKDYLKSTKTGLAQSKLIFDEADLVWSDSHYNAEFFEIPKSKSLVLPVIRDYARISSLKENQGLSKRLHDGRKNILFVGRVTPNKAQHDLFFLLKLIHTHIDPTVRLILVGCRGIPTYDPMIIDLAEKLGLTVDGDIGSPHARDVDILAPGSVDERDMATYYRHSDAFVCLSDHEGFCVPLVEAMFFGLPIIAHASSAVPETLGDGGVVIDKNDPVSMLSSMKAVLKDDGFASTLKEKSRQRANDFSWKNLENRFDEVLNLSIEHYNKKRIL